MTSVSESDQYEISINGYEQAVATLARLPESHPRLTEWLHWAQATFSSHAWLPHLNQIVTIAYARMAVRNGILSDKPRSYHNERHINDLLCRVIYCARQTDHNISHEGLAILSFFAACHDLRQSEPAKNPEDNSLVGSNEMASHHEALRIIEISADHTLWNPHNRLLLKTMIEGSTFGSGGKRSKNFFQGNLAKHLLSQQQNLNEQDQQLILLACDLDTANVSLPIDQFAESGIQVFDELVTHHNANMSAHQFFSEQQKVYFFDQQAFHAELSQQLFQPKKNSNQQHLLALCDCITQLPDDTPTQIIKQQFLDKARSLGARQ